MTEIPNRDIIGKLVARDGLRCSITGEDVRSSEELIVAHRIPKTRGGTEDLSNLHLVKKELGGIPYDISIARSKELTKQLREQQRELERREKDNFERQNEYRKQIERQMHELDLAREKLNTEYKEKEKILERNIQEKLESLEIDQKKLLEREKLAFSHFEKIREELAQREESIKIKTEELERERELYSKEHRVKLQSRSNAYVNDAIVALDTSAKDYHSKGKWWSIAGSTALAFGVAAGIAFGVTGLAPIENGNSVSWPMVSFLAFKGMIVIGLFIALAKYCFTYSQSFTHEAIKNSERKHAINFGKFYLETYGADAQWGQVKEAFEHWNINSTSAFAGQDSDKFDPKIFDKAMEIAEAVKKFGKEKEPPQA